MSASRKLGLFALVGAVLSAGLLGLAGCGTEPPIWPEGKSPRIVASFPPLDCFVRNVAGDEAAVLCLLKDQGPHGYQYNPPDMLMLRQADLFFTNGLGLDDHFTNPMARNCGNSRLVYVKLGEAIPRDRRLGMKEDHAHDHQHHHHAHGGDDSDPHVWLGIDEAIRMVEAIARELSAREPNRDTPYAVRAEAYIKRLNDLHKEEKEKLAGRKVNLVTAHESMAYFARSFGLNVVDSIQFHPGSDPNAARIRDLADKCVKNDVRVIAVEPQYPDSTAQMLLRQLEERGVRKPVLVIIDPLETAEPGELDKEWYERKMRQNIKNLVEALQ